MSYSFMQECPRRLRAFASRSASMNMQRSRIITAANSVALNVAHIRKSAAPSIGDCRISQREIARVAMRCYSVLVIESDTFSLDPTTDDDHCTCTRPLGEDLAADLACKLSGLVGRWKISKPVHEPYGTLLPLLNGHEDLHLTITRVGRFEPYWAVLFAHHQPLDWLLRRGPNIERLEWIKSLTIQVMRADPRRYQNMRWLEPGELNHLL